MTAPRRHLLWIARAEGVSFLVLLGIAMPLKYLADLPVAVRVSGAIHGALFVAFLIALARVAFGEEWPFARIAKWLVASVIPVALFFLERELRDRPDRG